MKLRKLLGIKKKQPLFKQVQVGNYSLLANGIHPVEDNLKYNKYYSRNLPRIAKYLESKYPTYGIIDVGANIGDTVALIRSHGVKQHIYAVEGEPTYVGMLKQNMGLFKDVTVFETFLGEATHRLDGGTEVTDGTARLNKNSGTQIQVTKLDDLATENNLQNIKLLKIDTDGFDFKILRGSLGFIKEQKPVIFFEYDAVYLEEQGENGTDIFASLHNLGYNTALFYDNYGKLLLSLTIDNTATITQLYNYMRKKESAFPYYDVCVFHKNDEGLANEVLAKETAFFS
ncbi:MAG: FkbM family methyltransferase [Mucilaginibacter sp.]